MFSFYFRVEEALRRINPRVALPYWDSSLDFDLPNPVDSLIWTTGFLGNGDGFVISGPFANWQTPSGPLTRNIGGASRLISKEVIRTIFTRCLTREISEPTAMAQFNLELAHGGPHVWVGGQMAGLNTAAHDPVFFLHHAFIDYLWEVFRRRQARRCGVNPNTDYPETMGQHSSQRPMDGFPQFRAIDGYQSFWTRFWYNYERSPWCSFWRPFCRTPYLRCDVNRQRCIARPRRTAAGSGAAAERRLGVGPLTSLASANARVASASRGNAQENLINVGPRFRAPPSDGRSQDARRMTFGAVRAGLGGFQRTGPDIQVGILGSARNDFGPIFNAPPSDGRTSDQNFNGESVSVGAQSQASIRSNADSTREVSVNGDSIEQSAGLLNADGSLRPPVQNTFFLNGRSDVKQWAYIPIKIIYRRTENDRFSAFPVRDGLPSRTNDVFSPAIYQNLRRKFQKSPAQTYQHCKTDKSGARQITVTADGLNYMGTFSDYALIDSRLPMSSAMTYIGIKSPDKGMTEVLVAAHDGCGRMCEPRCLDPASKSISYKPCTGVLRITSEKPKYYGKTFGDAIADIWQWTAGRTTDENIRLVFYCTYESWPWKNCYKGKEQNHSGPK